MSTTEYDNIKNKLCARNGVINTLYNTNAGTCRYLCDNNIYGKCIAYNYNDLWNICTLYDCCDEYNSAYVVDLYKKKNVPK